MIHPTQAPDTPSTLVFFSRIRDLLEPSGLRQEAQSSLRIRWLTWGAGLDGWLRLGLVLIVDDEQLWGFSGMVSFRIPKWSEQRIASWVGGWVRTSQSWLQTLDKSIDVWGRAGSKWKQGMQYTLGMSPQDARRLFEPKDVSCHTGEPPKIYMNMYVIVYVHLEPQWPIFWRSPPQNKAFSKQNKGHLASRYI